MVLPEGSTSDGVQFHTDNAAATYAGNLTVHALAGGIGATLGGGKFANGAATAAFGYLFNDAMHAAYDERYGLPPGVQPAQNTCGFFCSLLGGPVDIKDASGNVIGTYNHQMFDAGMQATGVAAGTMDAAATAAIGGTAAPVVADELGPAGSVFGRTRLGGSSIGDINANPNLRIGWGWSGTQAEGTNVFRISGKWLDALTGVKNSHIDLFSWGGK